MEFEFQLSKLLPLFIKPLPISIGLALAALSLLNRSPKVSRTILVISLTMLITFSLPMTANSLLHSLEKQYPPLPIADIPKANAIVLLTGGLDLPEAPRLAPELGSRGDRLRLTHLLLTENKSELLIISGGNSKSEPTVKTEADHTQELMQNWGLSEIQILKETKSRNTRESVQELLKVIDENQIETILLVTSAFHMPRSMQLLKDFPAVITPIVSNVLITEHARQLRFTQLIPSEVALSGSALALHEYLGMLANAIRRQ
jgi:uncharacterized SAM-binding protein YcdF (DUF218 family)